MKLTLLIISVVFSQLIYSQSSLESSFNSVYNGRNVNLSFKKEYNKLAISAGLKYHINRPELVPIGTFFRKTATAKNFSERIGFQIGFDYFFFKNDFCRIGAFYSNQFSRITETIKMYYALEPIVAEPQSEFDYSYIKSERTYGPVLASDNIIGVVIETNITKQIYFITKGGFGMMFWKNTDSSVILSSNLNQRGYNFDSFVSFGCGYKFQKK